MRHKVFAVFDSKAEGYLQPFFSFTAGQATRMFSDAVQDSGHQFHKHAADYTLFQIGEYEDATGTLVETPRVSLGSALEYLAKAENVRMLRQTEVQS